MEMKEYLLDPVGREEAIRIEYHPPAAEAEEDVVAVAAVATPASAASGGGGGGAGLASRVPPPPPLASSNAPSSIPSSEDAATITNNDNLEANEEYANFGLARGTTNTYVIPGMDEMTPEEYRTKLQENISARQVSRKPLGTCCIILPVRGYDVCTYSRSTSYPTSLFHSTLRYFYYFFFFIFCK